MGRLILDFDGTIIDVWLRYYKVFCDIVGTSKVTFDNYKEYKIKYHKDSIVAKELGYGLPTDYFEKKAIMLEEEQYLKLDTLTIDQDILNFALSNGDALILTKRRNIHNFEKQIEHLNIISNYVVTMEPKKLWISEHFSDEKDITIVGDSLNELEAATLPNVKAIMVGYGLFSYYDFIPMNISFMYLNTIIKISVHMTHTGGPIPPVYM